MGGHTQERSELHRKVWLENLKGDHNKEGLRVDGNINPATEMRESENNDQCRRFPRMRRDLLSAQCRTVYRKTQIRLH